MSSSAPTPASRYAIITGSILSGLVILFLIVDAGAKIARIDPVVKGTAELGYAQSIILPLGVVLMASTLLYAFPRTAVLGAIVLTGYLGGAVATHARLEHPLFSHTLFPVYLGVLLWLGLYLRDLRVRAIAPLRR